jgi:hypothetical protein
MKAIALPYVTYQNEPSKPDNVLIDLPDGVAARDELLHAEWNAIFDGDSPVVISDSAYGDLEIGDGDCFIYYTYVN